MSSTKSFIPELLLSQLYDSNNSKSLNVLLKSDDFKKNTKLQIIADHKKQLKYFKFNESLVNTTKRTHIRQVTKTGEFGKYFYLIEILDWNKFDIEKFKQNFQFCYGILVLLSKTISNDQFDHNLSFLLDGLNLSVIIVNDIEGLEIENLNLNPLNLQLQKSKKVSLDNVKFSKKDKLIAPHLQEIVIKNCSNEVFGNLNLEKLSSFDILINIDDDIHGKHELVNVNLEKLIWGNFRNVYKLENLNLSNIENMLILIAPNKNTKECIISEVNAPKLKELTIEFHKKFPIINQFNIPELKSIKLTKILGQEDNDEDFLNSLNESSLASFQNVKHWELYNSISTLSKDLEITKNIEILNLTVFKNTDDKLIKALNLQNLKVLNLNKSDKNGEFPNIRCLNLNSLTVSFENHLKSLDNLNSSNFPNLIDLSINNSSEDLIDELKESNFKKLINLTICGSIFTEDNLDILNNWELPNLKKFSHEFISEDPKSIKINFRALNLEEIKINLVNINNEHMALEIGEYPKLNKLETNGFKEIHLNKVENLKELVSLSPISLIKSNCDLLNLKSLSYDYYPGNTTNDIEFLQNLNKNVVRNCDEAGEDDENEETEETEENEFENYEANNGFNLFNNDDIEEEY